MKTYTCVSFLLIRNNQVLLEKRSLLKESDPGLIAIPGGHMEEGETQAQTLKREIDEELGVRALTRYFLCSLYHAASTELQLIHYYVIGDWQGDIKAFEADEVFWVNFGDAQIDIEADRIALSEYVRIKDVLEERIST